MKLTREQRKARRRRIIQRAVALAKELHSQDEEAQKEFIVGIVNRAIDIPGLGEVAERKILMAVAELLIDLASEDGDDNG
tara:strand:+ start:776 stop:1015 length:240 start_codon:yes stop_codon:yes gene_type:complete